MAVLRVSEDLHKAAKEYAEQHGMKLALVGTHEHLRAIVGGSIGAEEHARLLERIKDLEDKLAVRTFERDEARRGSAPTAAPEEDRNATILRILSDEVVPLSDDSELPAVEIVNWRIARGAGRKGVEVSPIDAVCMMLGTAYGRMMAVARDAAKKKPAVRRKAAA